MLGASAPSPAKFSVVVDALASTRSSPPAKFSAVADALGSERSASQQHSDEVKQGVHKALDDLMPDKISNIIKHE